MFARLEGTLYLLAHQPKIKSRVQCFSRQVVMNKAFFLTLKKIHVDLSCNFREKHTPIPKNAVTEPRARLL